MRVGLVSDTHGLADPRLPEVLAGCDLVLHAGDVVKEAVLVALRRIAPVTAVRGNCDEGTSLARLPASALVPLGPLLALLVHDAGAPDHPAAEVRTLLARHRPHVVVHGHSHRPGAALAGGALFVNPGSAGPRRFHLPRAAAVLDLDGRRVRVAWFDLAAPRGPLPLREPFEASL
jgi:putative phosphoesterase